MTNFNDFFNTNYTTYNKNGIDSFKAMLKSNGFNQTRSDWFQCGYKSSIKYVFRNKSNFICFSHNNSNGIEISNYKLTR